jgi:hypothetical protein
MLSASTAVVLRYVIQIALISPLHGGTDAHGHRYFFGPNASHDCLLALDQLAARIDPQYQMNFAGICKPFDQTDTGD